MLTENKYIVPAFIISIFFVIGVLIIGEAWRNHTRTNQTITVTGSAKKLIISDLGIIRANLNAQGSQLDLAYRELNNQIPILKDYLISKGISLDSIEFSAPTNYPIYEYTSSGMQTNRILAYVWNQNFSIMSKDVNKIKDISLEISLLVEKGVRLQNIQPEYHYTKLAEIKIDIQAEAAKDAMERAKKIAESTGRKLGNLRSARMGVLQITPKFSNMVSDYGINDLSSIEKEITAVVSASFEIR